MTFDELLEQIADLQDAADLQGYHLIGVELAYLRAHAAANREQYAQRIAPSGRKAAAPYHASADVVKQERAARARRRNDGKG